MPDFSKTIIYKIVHAINPDEYDVYVGHTTNIQSRKRCHKSYCNNLNSKKYNLKVYKFIRENGGWDNFEILEIEKYPCNSKDEARQKEQEWCYKLNSKLNCEIPNRTNKEWREDNRDKINEKAKIYREDNREKRLEYNKQYRQDNREKLKEYRKNNRDEKKEYDKKRRKEKNNLSLY
jgi:hypothetical protein